MPHAHLGFHHLERAPSCSDQLVVREHDHARKHWALAPCTVDRPRAPIDSDLEVCLPDTRTRSR